MDQQDRFFRQAEVQELAQRGKEKESAQTFTSKPRIESSSYESARTIAMVLTLCTLGVLGNVYMYRGLFDLSSKHDDDHMRGRGYLRGALTGYLILLFAIGLVCVAILILSMKLR